MAGRSNPDINRDMTYTTTDATLEKRDISEVIELLDPFETPILNMVGQDSLHFPCEQIKHEWIEDNLIPRAGTLSVAYVAGSGTMTLASGEGDFLYQDDTFLAEDIMFRVTSQTNGSDVIGVEVLRGTDAAIASGKEWRKLAHAANEGASSRDEDRKTVSSLKYNYTQILKDWIIITGTMDVIKRYGYVSERAYQEEKVLKNLAMDFEEVILYGGRSYEAGPPRKSTMGGLWEYVYLPGIDAGYDWVYNASGSDFSEAVFNDVLQAMWANGAHPDFVLVNGTNKRRISDWGKPYIRTERTETTAGASIGTYVSDFGSLDIILDRHLRASDVVIGTKGQLGLGPLNGRQFSSRLLPAMGDYIWYEILGEYTMECHRPSVDFGWIYNTSKVY